MPIDSHSYLVARGWEGKGFALKKGGIERPVVQAQKKNLKGVGSERDDGFQFWDHVYSVAADAIQIKIAESDDEQDSTSPSHVKKGKEGELQLTQTGILSNRRPSAVLKVLPSETLSVETSGGKYDILALARRKVAKDALYSRFHRGEVIHNDDDKEDPVTLGQEDARGTVPDSAERKKKKSLKRKRKHEHD